MKIGYVRVSTVEQNTIRQEIIMKELGVDRVFVDRASGKNTDRQALQEMLEFAREGDTVIVESYSRLARSTRDLLHIVDVLNSKKVEFVSKKESIDTSTPAGRLMLTIFAGLAQFEREITLERQAEGIAAAKMAGKYKGRKPIKINRTAFKKLYRDWKDGKITAVEMRKTLKLAHTTFYRKIREYEEKTKNGNENTI